MNLMYFKTMRGDRDSGFPTSTAKTYRSGGLGSESCDIGTGGFGSSWAGGVAQKWFSQGPTLGSTASQPAPRGTAVIPMDDLVPSPQHHLRTHLLLDLSGAEDQGSGGSRSNSSGSKHSGGKWIQPPRSDGRPDVRYQRIRGDPTAMIADPGIPGSRSVRSGLYDTEVCLTVGGLGGLKGGTVMQNNGAMCPRTGKQVTFGQRSPTGLEDPLRVRSQDPSLSRSKRDSSVRSRDSERTKTSTLPRTRSSSRQPDSKSRDDSDATYGRRRRDKGDSDLSSIDDVNLSNMQGRDCFIIPVNNVRRFLPAGVGLPRDRTGEVQILEMADPQLVVLLHFMSPLLAIQPVFESPLSRPPLIQKNLAQELLAEVLKDRPGAHGMLLCSIEHNAEYPFINYGVANRQLTVADEFQQAARFAALDKFNPSVLQYFSEHLVDSYEECATIARPPIHPASRRPVAASTGYIVSVYKVFEGDDGETFERNWLYWTGARMLYQCLPKSVGLRRITLHKSMSQGDKLYTLMCECSHFMDHVQDAAHLVPALRARLCGYSSIYKVAGVY